MKAFDEQHAQLTLSDVARIVGLPRASTRRALLTLESLGYVTSNGRLFSLSPQVLTLARAYLASSPVPRKAFWKMSAIRSANPARCRSCMAMKSFTSPVPRASASARYTAMSARICRRIAPLWDVFFWRR
jgi:DNA-binding IclR family transcriptional regulator